jgi:hypothetical protein
MNSAARQVHEVFRARKKLTLPFCDGVLFRTRGLTIVAPPLAFSRSATEKWGEARTPRAQERHQCYNSNR